MQSAFFQLQISQYKSCIDKIIAFTASTYVLFYQFIASFYLSPFRGGGGLHAKSCLTLCDPMNCSLPGSSVHGVF